MADSNRKDRKERLLIQDRKEYDITFQSKLKYSDQWFRTYKIYNTSLDKVLNWDKRRPHFFIPKVFSLIQMEAARYIIGLFGSPPFIKCDPRNKLGMENKLSVQTVLEYYLQMAKIFKVMVDAVMTVLLYGTVGIVPSWRVKPVTRRKPIFSESSEDNQRKLIMMETEEIAYRGLHLDVYQPWNIYPYHPFAADEHLADNIKVEDWISEKFYNKMVAEGKYDEIDYSLLKAKSDPQSDTKVLKKQHLGHPVPVGADDLIQRWRVIYDDHIDTILAQNYVVSELDSPFPFHGKSFIRGIKTSHPDEFFGGDSVKTVEQIQLGINTLFNQMFAIMALTIDPVVTYKHGVNPAQILSFPMQRIRVTNQDDIQFQKPPAMGFDPYNIYKMLLDIFDESTGFTDIKKGILGRQETATTTTILAQAAEYRIRFDVRVFEEFCIAPLAEMARQMIKEWMPANQEFLLTGKNKWQNVSREQLEGQFAYRCGGSEMTSNLAVDREALLRFLQVLIRMPFVASNPESIRALVREIATFFPLKNIEEIVPEKEAPSFIDQLLSGEVSGGEMRQGQTNLPALLASQNQGLAPRGVDTNLLG